MAQRLNKLNSQDWNWVLLKAVACSPKTNAVNYYEDMFSLTFNFQPINIKPLMCLMHMLMLLFHSITLLIKMLIFSNITLMTNISTFRLE